HTESYAGEVRQISYEVNPGIGKTFYMSQPTKEHLLSHAGLRLYWRYKKLEEDHNDFMHSAQFSIYGSRYMKEKLVEWDKIYSKKIEIEDSNGVKPKDQYSTFNLRLAMILSSICGNALGLAFKGIPFIKGDPEQSIKQFGMTPSFIYGVMKPGQIYYEDPQKGPVKYGLVSGQWGDEGSQIKALMECLIMNGGLFDGTQFRLAIHDWVNHGFYTPWINGCHTTHINLGTNISSEILEKESEYYQSGEYKTPISDEEALAKNDMYAGSAPLCRLAPIIMVNTFSNGLLYCVQQSRVTHASDMVAFCCELLAWVLSVLTNSSFAEVINRKDVFFKAWKYVLNDIKEQLQGASKDEILVQKEINFWRDTFLLGKPK